MESLVGFEKLRIKVKKKEKRRKRRMREPRTRCLGGGGAGQVGYILTPWAFGQWHGAGGVPKRDGRRDLLGSREKKASGLTGQLSGIHRGIRKRLEGREGGTGKRKRGKNTSSCKRLLSGDCGGKKQSSSWGGEVKRERRTAGRKKESSGSEFTGGAGAFSRGTPRDLSIISPHWKGNLEGGGK